MRKLLLIAAGLACLALPSFAREAIGALGLQVKPLEGTRGGARIAVVLEAAVPLEHVRVSFLRSDGVPLTPGTMLYLGSGRREVSLRAAGNARLLLVGGEPFGEDVLMWWNFVGRSHDEIAEARSQWAAGERFGTVQGAGDPLAAPPLPPGRLKAGGATR